MIDTYYTYEIKGKLFDHSFITKTFAKQSVAKWYGNEQRRTHNIYNGQEFYEEAKIIAFHLDPVTGHKVIDKKEHHIVEYIHNVQNQEMRF